jgi:hypothetical protein
MIKIETETPIYVLLLHSDAEYYDWIYLPVGWVQCACQKVETFEYESEVMEYIENNNLTKYIDTYEFDTI